MVWPLRRHCRSVLDGNVRSTFRPALRATISIRCCLHLFDSRLPLSSITALVANFELWSQIYLFSAVRSRNGTTPPTDAGRGHAARDACLATGPPARSMRRAAAYLPRPKRFSPLGAEWEHGTRQERPPPRPSVGLLPACSPPRVPSSGRGPPRARENARWAPAPELGEIQSSCGSIFILTKDSHLFNASSSDP